MSTSPPAPVFSDRFRINLIFADHDGVVKLVDGLKIRSSCGVHNINSKVLSSINLIPGLFLIRIFMKHLAIGQVPKDKKIGITFRS